MSLDPSGYWGVPTGSIDWCEANYAVTPYVCEFFNSLSSLAMVVAGIVGLRRHGRDRAVGIAFGLLVLVGLGSAGFHGTLRFGLQMLDELPMLYLVTWIAWLLVEPWTVGRGRRWLLGLLIAYLLFATAGATLTRGQVQFLAFQVSFGALELACLTRVGWLALRPENGPVRRSFAVGIVAYVVGVLAWFADLQGCRWLSVTLPSHGIPNPQLHAWWHVLVSVGFLLLLGVVAYDRKRREA